MKILQTIVGVLSIFLYPAVALAQLWEFPQEPVNFRGFQWPSNFTPQTPDEIQVYDWVASHSDDYNFLLWNMSGRGKVRFPNNPMVLDAAWNHVLDGVEYTPGVNMAGLKALVDQRARIKLGTELSPEILFRECKATTTDYWPASGYACEVDWVLRQGYSVQASGDRLELVPPGSGASSVGPGLFTQHGDKILLSDQGLDLMLKLNNRKLSRRADALGLLVGTMELAGAIARGEGCEHLQSEAAVAAPVGALAAYSPKARMVAGKAGLVAEPVAWGFNIVWEVGHFFLDEDGGHQYRQQKAIDQRPYDASGRLTFGAYMQAVGNSMGDPVGLVRAGCEIGCYGTAFAAENIRTTRLPPMGPVERERQRLRGGTCAVPLSGINKFP